MALRFKKILGRSRVDLDNVTESRLSRGDIGLIIIVLGIGVLR